MFQALGCKANVTQEKAVTSEAAAARVSAFLEKARVASLARGCSFAADA
jgi:hypothetical protein